MREAAAGTWGLLSEVRLAGGPSIRNVLAFVPDSEWYSGGCIGFVAMQEWRVELSRGHRELRLVTRASRARAHPGVRSRHMMLLPCSVTGQAGLMLVQPHAEISVVDDSVPSATLDYFATRSAASAGECRGMGQVRLGRAELHAGAFRGDVRVQHCDLTQTRTRAGLRVTCVLGAAGLEDAEFMVDLRSGETALGPAGAKFG